MLRLLPLLLLLAACYRPIYTEGEAAKETCRDLGHEGKAFDECVARRQHEAECRAFANSSDYSEAEARRRRCQ